MADDKQKLIESMLAMQKKFMAQERDHGLNVGDYFAPAEGHPLANYSQEYADLANKVVDMAHLEKGSSR
jgi:hypothetical protein